MSNRCTNCDRRTQTLLLILGSLYHEFCADCADIECLSCNDGPLQTPREVWDGLNPSNPCPFPKQPNRPQVFTDHDPWYNPDDLFHDHLDEMIDALDAQLEREQRDHEQRLEAEYDLQDQLEAGGHGRIEIERLTIGRSARKPRNRQSNRRRQAA